MIPRAGVIDQDLAHEREGIRRRGAGSQNRGGLGLGGHENEVPGRAQRALASGQVRVKQRARAVRDAVLVCIHKPDHFSG